MDIRTGIKPTHDAAVLTAEMVRQVAEKAASTQAAVNTAWRTYYASVITSDLANNNGANVASLTQAKASIIG
jgi:hypothetical protein